LLLYGRLAPRTTGLSADVVILDASALLELLLATPVGERVAKRLRSTRAVLAPAHVDAEVLSALGRLARAEQISGDVVTECLGDLADMPMTRVPLPGLLADAWTLHANVALRDALYAVVALRVDGALLTLDARLVRAVDISHPGVAELAS
jgi:predicted nucleic acid-binding protein